MMPLIHPAKILICLSNTFQFCPNLNLKSRTKYRLLGLTLLNARSSLTYCTADRRFSKTSPSFFMHDTSSSLKESEKLTFKEAICEMKVAIASKMFL